MDLKEFGLYFAELREDSGFKSQRQFALASKISNGTIARIEAGTQKATPETLITLASHLKGNPYISLLINIGYLDMLSEDLQNQLLRVEKYKGLILVLQSALNSFKVEGEISEIFIDVVLQTAKNNDIQFNVYEYKKDPIGVTKNILLSLGLENLDLISTSFPMQIDEIKSISDILSSSYDVNEQYKIMGKEGEALQTELEDEILERDDLFFYNENLNSSELTMINKLIRAALVTKSSGKASSELKAYLRNFQSPLYEIPKKKLTAIKEGSKEYSNVDPDRRQLLDLISKIPDEDLEDFKILAKRFIKDK